MSRSVLQGLIARPLTASTGSILHFEDIRVSQEYGKMCRTRMLGAMATAGRPYSDR